MNNSIFSVIQIVIVSICVFYLYKYIIQTIGLEKLGLWSLILSVTSLATIGNFGFTGSLVKFSAELSVKEEYKKINAILNTSVLAVSLLLAILLPIIFFIGYYCIGYFVDEKWISTSQDLLFYALISLYINIIAGLYFSILEGLNLAYLRSISFILATIFYMVIAIIFIGKYDILGLAYAQVLQALFFLILAILCSKTRVQNFNYFYFKWHKDLMKKVFNYSVNFQAIGIAQMLYDPITKAILSKYGSLDYVAVFEMASKLVIQVRSISTAIIQNVVPKIVTLNVTFGSKKILDAYKKIHNINLFLMFTSLVLIIPFANIISIFLLGESDSSFIIVLIVICFGWLLNSLNIPSYMINLGTGNLKWNVISHLAIGFFNLLFCSIVGYFFGNGMYIIFSWILSLIIGSSFITIEYHLRNKLLFQFVFNKVFFKLSGLLVLLLISSYYINNQTNNIYFLIIVQITLVLIYFYFIIFKIEDVKKNIVLIYQTKKQDKKL